MTSRMLETFVFTNLHSATKPRGDWRHLTCPACADKGKHLGINLRTGHIVCIRCGIASHATWISKSGLLKPRGPVVDPEFWMYFVNEGVEGSADSDVAEYASSRGLSMKDPQVAYGRGPAAKSLVFIQYDNGMQPNYIQWRSLTDHIYRAVAGTQPRLNHVHGGQGKILVLNEGPVDAIRVRTATGLWTSPLCSTRLDANYVIDIVLAEPKLVIIMLDNDDAGIDATPKVQGKLNGLGIETRVVSQRCWGPNGPKDPGEATDEQIVDAISECLNLG